MRDYEIKVCRHVELKSKKDMEFEGYASVFGNKDSWDDIMQQGAFSKTIEENFNRIKVLEQHDNWKVIGRPSVLEEDNMGLYFNAKLSDIQAGREMFTLIKDKAITEMSIGYNTIKSSRDEETGTRTLTEVRLWEISPVTWGANELARIKSMTSVDFMKKYDMLESEIRRLKSLLGDAESFLGTQHNKKPINVSDSDLQSLIDFVKNKG